jgi:hypothetical protein
VDQWITEEDYRNSRSGYGCPPQLVDVLDLPINDEPTYTDLLVDAAIRIGGSVDYLEIGVSVGKNFFVLANALRDSRLYGFDWEAINPTIERRFRRVGGRPPVSTYRYRTNTISYVQGDIFEDEGWRALAGRRFNIVFSDACHRAHALLRELDKMRELDLIDPDRFFMLWDDLDADPNGPVSRAFWRIAEELEERFGSGDANAFMLRVNGWLGQHEHRHTVGIINSIGLTRESY